MKKILSIVLLFNLFCGALGAQQKDLVVLLDTSLSMFDYQQTVVSVFFKEVLKERVKNQDFFHLISFSASPEKEIDLELKTIDDSEKVLKRLLLLKALGENTDLVTALGFVKNYAAKLPKDRKKTIAIFTDGVHNPLKPETRTQEEVTNLIKVDLQELKEKGYEVIFYQIPAAPDPKTLKPGEMGLSLKTISEELGLQTKSFDPESGTFDIPVGSLKASVIPDLGEIKRKFSISLTLENPNKEKSSVKLKSVRMYGSSLILENPTPWIVEGKEKKAETLALAIPSTLKIPSEINKTDITFVFEGEQKTYPDHFSISFIYKPLPEFLDPDSPIFWILIIAAILVLILLFVIFRTLGSKSKKTEKSRTPKEIIKKDQEPIHQNQPSHFEMVKSERHTSAKQDISVQKKESPQLVYQKKSVGTSLEATSQKNSKNEFSMTKPEKKSIDIDLLRKKPTNFENIPKKSQNSNNLDALIEARKSSKIEITKKSTPPKKPMSLAKTTRNFSSQHGDGGKADIPLKAMARKHYNPSATTCNIKLNVKLLDPPMVQSTLWNQNVRSFKIGDRKFLGGSKEPYKVLLIPIKAPIAELVYEESGLKMIPIQQDYFLDSWEGDILNQPIRLKTQDGKIIQITFSIFEDKKDKINNLLRR